MNKETQNKIDNIKNSLDDSIKRMLNDEQKMKKLIAAILSEPCHLKRVK